jgi:dTDP-4-dehydrorhamnose reductase
MASPMKLLLLGGSGQVGRSVGDLARHRDWKVLAPTHKELDIVEEGAVLEYLRRHSPGAVVNAAAYTAVDRAEMELEAAFKVNCKGARLVAEAAARTGLPLVHLSSDYVFDGSRAVPHVEADPVCPLGIYAKSKEEGECAVREAAARSIILRTAWVYSPFGSNFVRTMLRLAGERSELSVVSDQTGNPTYAIDLGQAIIDILAQATARTGDIWGTYHYAGRDAVSWYGFASAIFSCAKQFGISPPQLRAVGTNDFPRPALRPTYSVLSTKKIEREFGLRPRPLRDSLTDCLTRIFGEVA